MRAIFVLSSKSSGSTALQNYLKANFGYRTIHYTQHQEEETLYWSKVASVLGLPQEKLHRSVVPLKPERAVRELNEFFKRNQLPHITIDCNTTEKEFQEYFFQLIKKTGEKFIEKSPHHLYNASNLQLLENFKKAYADKVDITILGLIRHPQAVIFSAWRRWKYLPGKFQKEWLISYQRLLDWKKQLDILFLKYEDLVTGEVRLSTVLGEKENVEGNFSFRTSSVNKWAKDPFYGFSISNEVEVLAEKFGYENLNTQSSFIWRMNLWKQKLINAVKAFYRKVRKK